MSSTVFLQTPPCSAPVMTDCAGISGSSEKDRLRRNEAAIEDGLVIAKVGVTPLLELLHFLRDQYLDRFSQLLFKQSGVEANPGKNCLHIIQHGSEHFGSGGYPSWV